MVKTGNTIPNLRHLRAFREVAVRQSVSAAAESVYLSQPAITQAIAKLEDTLGVTLFDRRSGGMFVTEPGNRLLDRVTRMLDYLRAGAREAARVGHKKGARGFANFDSLLTSAQLRALVAVARTGNFTLAARNTGISQPALHRASRDLERLSGMALFNKASCGIELTRPAAILAQHTKLALSELEQAFAEIDEWLGRDTGRIVVGTMPLARSFVLPRAINALLSDRPEVAISVVDGPYDTLLSGLRHGEIDLLIGALRMPPPIEDVRQDLLFDDPLAVVARVDHPLAGRRNLTRSDLLAYPWIVPREGTPTRQHFDCVISGEEGAARIGMIESSSLSLIRSLLADSDRLTLISDHQVRREVETGLLARLDFALPGTARPIGVTTRSDWRPTATQEAFLGHLRAAGKMI